MRQIAVMVYGRRPATAVGLVAGIAEVGSVRGWQLLVRSVEDPNLIPLIRGGGVCGVIAMAQDEAQGAELAAVTVPMVNVITGYMEGKVPSVLIDDEKVGEVGARHLASLGFRRVSYVGVDNAESRLRERGFESAAEKLGLTYAPCRGAAPQMSLAQEPNAGSVASGREVAVAGKAGTRLSRREQSNLISRSARPPAIAHSQPLHNGWSWMELMDGKVLDDWLGTVQIPLGVMCFNDQLASHVVDSCLRLGKRVPDDVAVLGVDNDELLCPYSAVPISSVDPGLKSLGQRAAEMLQDMIEGKKLRPEVVWVSDHGVVARQSTDTVVVDDLHVRDALEFIRAKAGQRIAVKDVLKRVRLSRATLDRRFQDAIGRTVGEEIRQVRAKTAGRLLRDTRMTLLEVSKRSGFASQQHLCRAFRIAFGMSPGVYRKRETQSRFGSVRAD